MVNHHAGMRQIMHENVRLEMFLYKGEKKGPDYKDGKHMKTYIGPSKTKTIW